MITRQPKYSKEEFARRGDEIYEHDVLPNVGSEDYGKFVAIDIESRQWEMDADEMAADNRLLARIPDAQLWATRVGFGYLYHFGGVVTRRQT
jgi:hypothetical protein